MKKDVEYAKAGGGLERKERPIDPLSKPSGPGDQESGPKRPEPDSPSRDNLMKRMRKVDPKQAEKYRQRTGE
ncbi:MAG: ubiquitin-like protein UBact [Nitrospiraceae bacterium]|nr:ubiquitin-like protein UBact [Nitrospira sp.]MCA9457067.1 ubiquitin-like protein UBact [Nitrospira sp.]MCB9774037.1 ubiquitin-like protein UBact [Nitrospiraceae bacterium]